MTDKDYMKIALSLAAKADESTYPNPMVGAVIVKNGKIIGSGYHKKAGKDHAEIIAIKKAKSDCRDATMYVTLEPCNHYGRTPPCTSAIIASGIKKVVIAMKDPNTLTCGLGIKALRNKGVKVSYGKYAAEAALLNRKYIKFINTGMPYVTFKTAQSLDGKIAARDGSSRWISNDKSRKYVKKMRSKFDAILIGTNTLLKDDPFLLDEKRNGYNVLRIVIDSELKIPFSSNIIRTASKAPVLIVSTKVASEHKKIKLNNVHGVDVLTVRSAGKRVSLVSLFKELGKKGIMNILVEGGGEIGGTLMEKGLLDEVMFFVSPKLIGGPYNSLKGKGVQNISKALNVSNISMKHFGEDIFIQGTVDNINNKIN